MEYILIPENGQLSFHQSNDFLKIPSAFYGFHNTDTEITSAFSGREVYCFNGEMDSEEQDLVCPECGCKMHLHAHPQITLSHIPIGGSLSKVRFGHNRYLCPNCLKSKSQYIPFKSDSHRITRQLEQYVKDLLALGSFTNKEVATITGLNEHLVKDIDKKRLQEKYTLDGKQLKKPEKTTRFIGIDEFKLHDGYNFATVIIDMITGHILWIYHGKGKQGIFDFISHVGMNWMEQVEAVSCDMNANFFEAFEEVCEWIQPVFDHFHIIKNFNEKVVAEVRKDEQRRLRELGDFQGAEKLKNTKYILTSSRQTLERKAQEAAEGKIISKAGSLFPKEEVVQKGGQLAKYEELLSENKLFFTIDLVKLKLEDAYKQTDEARMAAVISDIMDICEGTGNRHFLWFRNLLDKHFEGIIAHATYSISNGKLEGLNNKIKTTRRAAYGYRDDDYFFLKLFDASRVEYVRNQKSHRILH